MERARYAAAVLLVAVIAQAAGAAPNARDHWRKGTDYARVNLHVEALEEFSAAIRLNKGEISIEESARVFGERGRVYQQMMRYEDALTDMWNALRLDDRNAALYNDRGLLYLEMRDPARAREDFRAAVKLDSRNPGYVFNKGRAEFEDRNFAQAIREFNAALALDPDRSDALYSRGLAYKTLEQYDQALNDFTRMLQMDPKASLALYQKAAIFARQGKIDVACVLLEEAIKHGFRDRRAIESSADFNAIRKSDCYLAVVRGL